MLCTTDIRPSCIAQGYVTAGEQEWDACSEDGEAAAPNAAEETTTAEADAFADGATAAAAGAALDQEAAAAWLGEPPGIEVARMCSLS